MSETVKPMSQLLLDATLEYQYTTPDDEVLWCPYVRNGGPFLPDPKNGDILSIAGAGKISGLEFQKAAQYAYEQVMVEGVSYSPSVVAVIMRRRLVDGRLPDNSYNYTGVDCSGFVGNVLESAFELNGRDFFEELKIPEEDIVILLDSTPDFDKKAELERIREKGGLSAREYATIIRGHGQPARVVDVARLTANSVPVVGEDIQPGDLAFYTPSGSRKPAHVAIVLDADRNSVNFAHSGRIDPAVEIGGVKIFTLPLKIVFNREVQHSQGGMMAIHRLRALIH